MDFVMPNSDISAKEWVLKYILPVIIIPILSSSIISYASIKSMGIQQTNDGKRIDQIEKSTNINRVEISKTAERVSKLEIVIENIDRTLSRQADIGDKNLSEMRKIRSEIGDIRENVAVLKDREDRDNGTNK